MEKLTALLDAAQEALPGLPGFRSLSLFGSLAEGRADVYSDIDLVVTTDDLPAAKTQVLASLEQIGAVESCWAINLRPDEWNPIVIFRDRLYYHRLELGLADNRAKDRTIPEEQTVLLTDQPRRGKSALAVSTAYVPEEGSLGHFLLGQFIGMIRYLKARKRCRTMSSYRFASAAVDWVIALRNGLLVKDPRVRSKLSTDQYVELYELLSAHDSGQLLSLFDLSSLTGMDAAVQSAMQVMLEDAMRLAEITGETLPTEVFQRMIGFVHEELR